MRAGLFLSIMGLCIGLATCGGASCLSVLNYEPPHPHWFVSVSDAATHPGRAKVDAIESRDYDVSINPSEGRCTLAVKNAEGKVLGKSKGVLFDGALCLVPGPRGARECGGLRTETGPYDDASVARIAPFEAIEREVGRLFPPK